MRIVVETVNAPEDLTKIFDKALDKGLRNAAQQWLKRFARGHFEESAVAKYGYQKRKDVTNQKKMNLKHHKRPLVMSWKSYHQIMASKKKPRIRKTATGKEATMRLDAPKYFYAYHIETQSDKVEELTTTLDSESTELGKEVLKDIDDDVARANVRKVKVL